MVNRRLTERFAILEGYLRHRTETYGAETLAEGIRLQEKGR